MLANANSSFSVTGAETKLDSTGAGSSAIVITDNGAGTLAYSARYANTGETYHSGSGNWYLNTPGNILIGGLDSLTNFNVTTTGASNFTGNLYSSGIVTASLGLSGSLTRLTDGTSYLKAGDNVTITSASNGSVTIAGTSGTVSFLPTGSLYSLVHNLSGANAQTTTFSPAFTAGVQFVPLRENRIITGVRMWNSHSAARNFKCSLWDKDENRIAVTSQQLASGEAIHTIPFGTSSYTVTQRDVGKIMYVSFYYESGTEYPKSTGGVTVPSTPFVADNHFVYTNLRRFGSGDSVPNGSASEDYMIEPIFATLDETT